jgi:N-acetylmuramoyl-L-alanine amidase
MQRRSFIQKLSVWCLSFLGSTSVFAKGLTKILSIPQGETGKKYLTLNIENKPTIKLEIFWRQRIAFISTKQLAKSLEYHTYFNDEKKKIVLYLPQNRVVVTANNAFVIVDDETYQMPGSAIWHKNAIYVPVRYFFPLLNRRTTLKLEYQEPSQSLQIAHKDVNIVGLSISAKDNGTVIRVRTQKKFKKGEITADMRYGWLHIDFYTGKIDTAQLKNTRTAGIIAKIKTFQFSELASLAFYLRKEPLSREIINNSDSNEVLIVLRTKEDIKQDQIAEIKESNEKIEPSDEIKNQLEAERRKWLIDVVVIDPGHGGKDPGTIGIGKTQEKDVVLSISKKLGQLIQDELPDVKVIYTRKSDKFVSLKKRTQIANEKNGKVFISIHANSNKSKKASGFETYILGPEKGDQARNVVLKENSVIDFEDAAARDAYKGINQILATMAQSAFSRQSEYLASLVQQELHKQLRSLKIKNRGVKQGPFWVMVGASMPNILVETGFVSNSFDVKILKTSAYQYKIATGIFKGFKRYKTDYESTI